MLEKSIILGSENDFPERMTAFAKKNGLLFTGPVYNTCLFDELSVVDPEHYLLQALKGRSEKVR